MFLPHASAQNFLLPLKNQISLAGNYAELRKNHFHMGLDFKTDGRENLDVFAVEAGYVSRILISPNGYGKCIYINHPKHGLTTVYAHLNEFEPSIQSWTDETQYALHKNTLDTILPIGLLPIQRGQKIALSGNTGSSQGAHLHFEFRHLISEKTINPLIFYPQIQDSKSPVISKLLLYDMDNGSRLLNAFDPAKIKHQLVKTPSNYVGIAIAGMDMMNNSSSTFGIYSLKIMENNVPKYQFKLDSLDFSWQSHIKSISDYHQPYRDIYKGFYEKCGFNLTDSGSLNGIISISANEVKNIKIVAEDFKGNAFNLEFQLTSSPFLNGSALKGELANCASEIVIKNQDFNIIIPPNGIDRDRYAAYTVSNSNNAKELLKIHLFSESTAALKPYQFIYLGNPASVNHSKLYIESSVDRKHKAYMGYWQGSKLIFPKVKNYGTLTLKYDLTAPTIGLKPIKSGSSIIFSIDDSESEIGSYKLTIDGQWRKLYYDEKNNRVIYKILPEDKGKKVNVLLEVEDRVGNKNSKSMEIFL